MIMQKWLHYSPPGHADCRWLRKPANMKFWEELLAYFPFVQHGLHMISLTILHCHVSMKLLPSNNRGIHRQTHRLSFDKTWTTQKMTCTIILLLLHVFIVMGTCSLSHCLATKGGIQFTKPLPSNDRRDTHTDTQTDGGIYEVCLWDWLRCHDRHTKFHKNWLRHSKVDRGIHAHTDRMEIA
jgi:hypothetical protein